MYLLRNTKALCRFLVGVYSSYRFPLAVLFVNKFFSEGPYNAGKDPDVKRSAIRCEMDSNIYSFFIEHKF